MRPPAKAVIALAISMSLVGCQNGSSTSAAARTSGVITGPTPGTSATSTSGATVPVVEASSLLPGMPAPLSSTDVWAADRAGMLSPAVAGMPSRVYVPNSGSNTVTVIDPATFTVLRTVRVGNQPQHIVPSWNLNRLWVNNNQGNSLTPINPRTGAFGKPVPVTDPYNLYFTPDGRYAMVMEERRRRIGFLNPETMAVHDEITVPCSGVNHVDFSADGRYFVTSCEFSGMLLKIDTVTHKLLATLRLPSHGSMPQDVKLSPDGRVFYVADMMNNGLWLIDGTHLKVIGKLRTGKGAHGLYITRDSASLLVTNRGEGTISVVNLATRKVRTTWRLPHGGSPDMGGISGDGKTFWVSGRYNAVVYAISTLTGKLIRTIRVGNGPHGLCIYPQPGRYSLGHTGVLR